MTDLEQMVDEAVFRAWQQTRPSLIEAVRDLLRHGQTPAQIERHLRRSCGNREMILQVRAIAEHLQRTQPDQVKP